GEARGVAAVLCSRRRDHEPRHRQGARRVPRRTRLPGRKPGMSRIARLAERLDAPLLVTHEPNLRYLTGFSSSNAALLVEPDGAAMLYADFRYASRGREVDEVTFVEVSRYLVPSLAERLAGRTIAFEAVHLPYAGFQTLEGAGVSLVPTTGLVEALRAVKDDAEIDAIRRAGALSDEVFELL